MWGCCYAYDYPSDFQGLLLFRVLGVETVSKNCLYSVKNNSELQHSLLAELFLIKHQIHHLALRYVAIDGLA